jgi:hypothetical protein
MINQEKRRIVIRIGQRHLSFTSINPQEMANPVCFEPYVLKSGISVAANLREALKGADLRGQGINSVLVLLDTPVLMVPVEQFEEAKMGELFGLTFPDRVQEKVMFNVLPDLNVVAVFGMNKDLSTVINDNFADVSVMSVMTPVWRHLHRRSFTGVHAKLYGYFHDQKLDIFAFQQNRFKFCNQFETNRVQDSLYFLLYVWNQMALNAAFDELHLMGDVPNKDALETELRKYLKKVYFINPSAEFNQAPVTQVKGMPFDLMIMFAKGR